MLWRTINAHNVMYPCIHWIFTANFSLENISASDTEISVKVGCKNQTIFSNVQYVHIKISSADSTSLRLRADSTHASSIKNASCNGSYSILDLNMNVSYVFTVGWKKGSAATSCILPQNIRTSKSLNNPFTACFKFSCISGSFGIHWLTPPEGPEGQLLLLH